MVLKYLPVVRIKIELAKYIILHYTKNIGNDDYNAGPYNLTIFAGATSTVFNISINNDNILENNENFSLTIDPSSLSDDVIAGSPVQAIVTIVDDDCKCVM